MKKISAIVVFCLSAAFLCAFERSACAAEFPRAQLDESERYFTHAYVNFLERSYGEASDYLERALRANTYFVDYYLLKGLTMNRLGDYRAGRDALTYYLEVRPMDPTAPRILSHAIAQQRDLRRALSDFALPIRWRTSEVDLQSELGLGALRPFNVKGLGKAEAFGSSLCLADTLGDRVYFRKKASGRVQKMDIPAPVAPLMMGDDTFHLLTASGDFYSIEALADASELLSPDLRGSVDSFVADAALLSANDFAVADPVAREIAFYSLPFMERKGAWSPSGIEMLFEPVGLAAYGPWLAVADRANGRIFFLNTENTRNSFSVEIPVPRDVAWSPLGGLFVLNDNGELFRIAVDFQLRSAEVPDRILADIREGWTLFPSRDGDLYCLDIGASRLQKVMMMPGSTSTWGFLSLHSPSTAYEKDKESFVVEANLVSPFASYVKGAAPVVHSVWNDRLISASALWKTPPEGAKAGIAVFHRPAPVGVIAPELQNMVVENGKDIQIVLSPLWDAQKKNLSNIVVDASLAFLDDDLDILTFFCLNNGLRLDLWARRAPSVQLLRASALTGGKTLFSLTNVPSLDPASSGMRIYIPLPQELSSSGYPSRSMLTVYLDLGLLQTRDWIPLWPDLLE